MSDTSAASTRPTATATIASIGVAVTAAITVAATVIGGVLLRDENDAGCIGADCNEGYALALVLVMVLALVVGTVVGANTASVLAVRRRPSGQRLLAVAVRVVACAIPLVWLIVELA